mmetsp:Transcript_19156/g.26929  ORF Transcript_19156/g.26929 Transcript_19156/m.26929 type:complete len:201 (-) Transcript_19156:161-763(-)
MYSVESMPSAATVAFFINPAVAIAFITFETLLSSCFNPACIAIWSKARAGPLHRRIPPMNSSNVHSPSPSSRIRKRAAQSSSMLKPKLSKHLLISGFSSDCTNSCHDMVPFFSWSTCLNISSSCARTSFSSSALVDCRADSTKIPVTTFIIASTANAMYRTKTAASHGEICSCSGAIRSAQSIPPVIPAKRDTKAWGSEP